MTYARNATIYSKGELATHSFKVISGAVRLSTVLFDGHRQVLDILLPNDTFGIDAASKYTATAEAIGETMVLRCPRPCIMHVQDGQPHAREELIAMLRRGLCAAHNHVAMLGHQGAKQRVAAFLLQMRENRGVKADSVIELPVGRQDMADYLGLTIETTCRVLTDLKTAQIISLPGRRELIINKLEALKVLADSDEA